MSEQAPEWVPTFEGQRPPFQPGHTLSIKHGATSPRLVDPLAADLVETALADESAVYLRGPLFRAAVWAWARAEAQVQLLTEYLGKAGVASGDGVGDLESDRVLSAYALLHRAEARAATGRSHLGLTPLARARLGRDVAAAKVDTAALMAQLHQAEQEEKK